jgi:hypothetical protein
MDVMGRLLIATSVLLTSGCVGGRGDAVEATTRLLKAGQSEEAAECESDLLTKSQLSDEGVLKVAVGVGSNTAMDDAFNLDEIAADLSGDDREAFREIADEFAECMD